MSNAQTIDLTHTKISDAQRREAEARLARERTLLRQSPKTDASPTPLIPSSASSDPADRKSKCEEEWRKYDESYACFNPYRLATGGVKAEAYEHCSDVRRPDNCE
jgi:hypothetical protein